MAYVHPCGLSLYVGRARSRRQRIGWTSPAQRSETIDAAVAAAKAVATAAATDRVQEIAAFACDPSCKFKSSWFMLGETEAIVSGSPSDIRPWVWVYGLRRWALLVQCKPEGPARPLRELYVGQRIRGVAIDWNWFIDKYRRHHRAAPEPDREPLYDPSQEFEPLEPDWGDLPDLEEWGGGGGGDDQDD